MLGESGWTRVLISRGGGITTLKAGRERIHWDRELTDDEMALLLENPWPMLESHRPRRWRPFWRWVAAKFQGAK